MYFSYWATCWSTVCEAGPTLKQIGSTSLMVSQAVVQRWHDYLGHVDYLCLICKDNSNSLMSIKKHNVDNVRARSSTSAINFYSFRTTTSTRVVVMIVGIPVSQAQWKNLNRDYNNTDVWFHI